VKEKEPFVIGMLVVVMTVLEAHGNPPASFAPFFMRVPVEFSENVSPGDPASCEYVPVAG
jgi:hypothetical protein